MPQEKETKKEKKLIDLDFYPVIKTLDILLADHTTGRNIIWATDSYARNGTQYNARSEITPEALKGLKSVDLQPRVYKSVEAQKARTKAKAEVYTPSWVCCLMNNMADGAIFGRENIFNTLDGHIWHGRHGKISFCSEKKDKNGVIIRCETESDTTSSGTAPATPHTWQNYVKQTVLEMACGEAPYLVSRYDTTTAEPIPLSHRIGMLDRKLRLVNENAGTKEEWLAWALTAYKSTYGYEWQGDSLLIARINLLLTFFDNFLRCWKCVPEVKVLKSVAIIISWNLWQMDGLNYTVPLGGPAEEENRQLSIFDLDCFSSEKEKRKEEKKEKEKEEEKEKRKEKKEEIVISYKNSEKNIEISEQNKEKDIKKTEPKEKEIYCVIRKRNGNSYIKVRFADLVKNNKKGDKKMSDDNVKKEKKKNMFGVCLSNAPYQESDGGAAASARPVYQYFSEEAKNIADVNCLIQPSRWMTGGKGLDEYRKKMIHDTHIKTLVDYADSKSVFKNVDIKGGVCIYVRDNKYDGLCKCIRNDIDGVNVSERYLCEKNDDIFIRCEKLIPIKKKVETKIAGTIEDITSPRKPYGLSGDVFKDSTKYNLPPFSINPIKNGYSIVGLGTGNKRETRYFDKNYPLPRKNNLNKYKLFVTRNYGCGEIGEVPATPVLATPVLATPGQACTETFVEIGSFDTYEELQNLYKYFCTKFFRCMVGIRKQDQGASRAVYHYVPLQDFTSASDIDWTKPIPEIDKQLYKKYELDEKEIEFIEKHVKEME